jgi:DNA-directed RNA polymerase subunit RPC12/RpoP
MGKDITDYAKVNAQAPLRLPGPFRPLPREIFICPKCETKATSVDGEGNARCPKCWERFNNVQRHDDVADAIGWVMLGAWDYMNTCNDCGRSLIPSGVREREGSRWCWECADEAKREEAEERRWAD